VRSRSRSRWGETIWRRAPALLTLVVLTLAGLALAGPGGAAAQTPLDYERLLGGAERETEPRISRPVAPVGPGAADGTGPGFDDYARIAEAPPDPMLDAARKAITLFRARLAATVERLPDSVAEIDTALAAASPTGRASYFLGVALFAGLLLIIGRAMTALFAVYLARPLMESVQRGEAPVGYLGKLPVLAYRVLLTVIGVAICLATAALVGLFFYQEHEATQITVIVVFAAYALVLIVDTLWRMAVAPFLPRYRLPAIADHDARVLYRWLSSVSGFAVISSALCYWMQALGLAAEVHTALTVLLSLVTVVLILAMLRSQRRAITGIILAGDPPEEATWLTRAVAALWGPLVALYVIFTWGDLAFRLIMGIETGPLRLAMPYVIFMAGLVVYVVASYVIERVFARARAIRELNRAADADRRRADAAETQALRERITGDGDSQDPDGDGPDGDDGGGFSPAAAPAPAPRRRRGAMQTMEDLARRTASLVAIGAVAYALIVFWGGADIIEETPALNLIEDVVDILLVGYILFHAVRIWIDQKIAEEGGDEEPGTMLEGEGGGAGATRLATLLPLFRNFLLIVIAVTVTLLVAIEMGINVAPLFAGAGIVGLAIGFGAQTLVRDILSGAFFLMDDAFRKGEYIDVGTVKGTVEKISLRSFQLRHHLGMLHTIPFGEIAHLTNYSRDWVMMKLPLRLTYDTDVERVRKLVKKLGQRLLEDPEIGDKFIQPVKSQGVIQMDDSAMIVRIKFMTYPGEQWVLRKRVYAEIRELFEKEGIKFAHREVTVRVPDLEKKELSPEQVQAIGAAARRVGDQVDEEMKATGTGGLGEVR